MSKIRHHVMDKLNSALAIVEELGHTKEAYDMFYADIVELSNELANIDDSEE